MEIHKLVFQLVKDEMLKRERKKERKVERNPVDRILQLRATTEIPVSQLISTNMTEEKRKQTTAFIISHFCFSTAVTCAKLEPVRQFLLWNAFHGLKCNLLQLMKIRSA